MNEDLELTQALPAIAASPRQAALEAATRYLHELGLVPFFAGRGVTQVDDHHLLNGAHLLHLDPQRRASAAFLARLRDLDRAFYGPRGQVMPSWVLYDCALAPGVIFGLAQRLSALPPAAAEVFAGHEPPLAGDELVPVSMLSVLPLPNRQASLVHTLAWLDPRLDGRAGLECGRATLALGLEVLGVRRALAVAGWRTPELALFASLGPLRLRTAWTPAHDTPATATFELERDLVAPRGSTERLPIDELDDVALRERLVALQEELEDGAPLWLEPCHGDDPALLVRRVAGVAR